LHGMALVIDPFRISTITAVAHVTKSSELDLQQLYDSIDIIVNTPENQREGFTFAEYGDSQYKGFHKKKNIIRRKLVEKKKFDGFVSVLYAHLFNSQMFSVNVKIFKNGKLQITGLKTEKQGHFVVDKIADYIKEKNEDFNIVPSPSVLSPGGFRICLINSDFWITIDGKKATILREKLYTLLSRNYETFCEFDSVVHPSVRANFCYNSQYQNKHGICECKGLCDGKGNGHGEGQCKKVTIAVFGSGCVIITGSQSVVQLQNAYNFIIEVIKSNYQLFIKEAISNNNIAKNNVPLSTYSSIMLNHSFNVL
jgi:TATA-box binding protein (TBP) (component of TFIID and TFIIIB)